MGRWIHGLELRKEFYIKDTRFAGLLHIDANHSHGRLSDRRKRAWLEFQGQ